jgi:hypothetical protein
MGRGGNWTLVGAAMIVGLMMALWFGMQSFSDVAGGAARAGTGKASAASSAGVSQSDIDALAKLFQ